MLIPNMEFRVWAVLPDENSGRRFVSEVVQKYPVSPMGYENDLPIYLPGENSTLVAFRVMTNNETQDEYFERLQRLEEEEEEVDTTDDREAEEVRDVLTEILRKENLKCYALIVNAREGAVSYSGSLSSAVSDTDRFTFLEDR